MKSPKKEHSPKASPTKAEVESALHFGILTREQAAHYLQCTTRHLERMVRSGRLRSCKPTRKFCRFRLADLDAFLESGASIAA